MQPPPVPPKLDYATLADAPPVKPTHPVVGILGFLIYGGIFLLLSLALFGMCVEIIGSRRGSDVLLIPTTVVSCVWLFTLWRAFAALLGVLHRQTK